MLAGDDPAAPPAPPMRLLAISDLHLGAATNRAALRDLPHFPEDWLILAGDVCEDPCLFAEALAFLAGRFARVVWTPGNHELWLTGGPGRAADSLAKYQALVAAARGAGVATPEDPYLRWPPTGAVIAPVLTLYDYSFRPADVPREAVRAWAAETRCVPADEHLIRTAPHFPGIEDWCAARCAATEARLAAEVPPGAGCVVAGHWPLREELVRIPRIPRFAPWCGTRRTEDWHRRFGVLAAISGHLHVRRSDRRDGTRFEEVSLGYPKQWDASRGMAAYLREVLPGPGGEGW